MTTGKERLEELGHKLTFVGGAQSQGFDNYKCEGCGHVWTVKRSSYHGFWIRQSDRTVSGWGVITCNEMVIKEILT